MYNFTKENYDLANKNNDLDRFRGDEISRRVGTEVPSNDQQALQTNMIDDMINGLPFSHLDEWNKYQAVRARVKQEVDAEMIKFEFQINN